MSEIEYKYLVEFTIDVKRTDNQMLTNDENAMVEKMRVATKDAIAKVMNEYGQSRKKDLGDKTVIY